MTNASSLTGRLARERGEAARELLDARLVLVRARAAAAAVAEQRERVVAAAAAAASGRLRAAVEGLVAAERTSRASAPKPVQPRDGGVGVRWGSDALRSLVCRSSFFSSSFFFFEFVFVISSWV